MRSRHGTELPADLARVLLTDPTARADFEAWAPGFQRDAVAAIVHARAPRERKERIHDQLRRARRWREIQAQAGSHPELAAQSRR
ncbi:MAG: Bacteriocin-protection, YdeI or OmpD-Associated [Thermoplasmata archaeon]|jgi:uncharacterized protein YdeI (YjbR/CyaY-like superfamily)|nr:Bacteriocin-protection, YdeI or OmpD-Associated [Thermoplasmata archaeon]